MAGKRKWFLLGLLGAVAGMVMKMVRGRRQEHLQTGHWETPAAPPPQVPAPPATPTPPSE